MKNPYEVLGVRQGASQDEIKAAYKALVKKYHPDKYQNNPLADLAEEKLQEVNEAYDALTKNQGSSGTYGYSYSTGGSSQTSGRGTYNSGSSTYGGSTAYYNVRLAIQRGDYAAAHRELINARGRDAEWYFLSGVVAYKEGMYDDALSNVRQAIDMDPGNAEYRQIYQQMTMSGGMYRSRSNVDGYNDDMCAKCLSFYCLTSWCSPCW